MFASLVVIAEQACRHARAKSMTSEVMKSGDAANYDRIVSVPTHRPEVGELLRDWRRQRRLSQFELALAASVSSRHLSFVETGRSRPSADMVLRLAEHLDVPLRERNQLLLAAGHAPLYTQRDLDAPALGPVREAIDQLLRGHEPYPALVVDGHWGLVAANTVLQRLIGGVADHLLQPPVNVLRLSLHPDGLAPRIANLEQWRRLLLERLAREALASGDPALRTLYEELSAYPTGGHSSDPEPTCADIAVPLRLQHDGIELALIATQTAFGTATDVTVAELSIESFFPADSQTAEVLQAMAAGQDAGQATATEAA
jgi:transcriptional regulator with XRE-family HTH domain